MKIGFRVNQPSRRAGTAFVERFRALPVANVSDSMARLQAAGPTLRPYYAGPTMAGPAFTVRTRPGDNLMVHAALDLAEPGDVIVVDAGGDLTNAIIGELMSAYAQMRRLAGIVVNGAIRDSAALCADAFPVFAAGVTHRGPYRDGPGELNVPISLGGMVIEPGDLVLGDADGLVSVPFDALDAVCAATEAKHAAEDKQMASYRAGEPGDRTFVEQALARLGWAGAGPAR